MGVARRQKPVQGDTVVLNLTSGLQRYTQQALTQTMAADRTHTTFGHFPSAPNGAVVVMDAQTGAVLAIASNPTYSLTQWVGGISTANYKALQAGCNVSTGACPLNDYAIQGLQAPGSTFKLATATAALDDGLMTPYSTIDDPGYFQLSPTQTLHDALGEVPGVINISQAITVSSDVFFYTLGARFYADQAKYGPTPIQNMAHRYGLGAPTGIDLPGVYNGWIDSLHTRQLLHKQYPNAYGPATWYLGDNVELAFGQGETEVTPLEEADAYATFANGGTRYAPELAGEIVSPGGKVVRKIAPKVEAHVSLPPSTYQTLLSGFEGVVQSPSGTAYAPFQGFDFSKWLLGGKTGTATATNNSAQQPTAWFVGFGGPRNDPKQRYAVAVEVDEAGYGSSGAAPVVRQMFDCLMAHHGVTPGYHPTTAAGG